MVWECLISGLWVQVLVTHVMCQLVLRGHQLLIYWRDVLRPYQVRGGSRLPCTWYSGVPGTTVLDFDS